MSTANIVTLHNRMTPAQYDAERAKLLNAYGAVDAKQPEITAKHNQAWAQLFARSGWTQEELAEKEGKERSYIARRLLFGRFLHFVSRDTKHENIQISLTEKRFREFWAKTDKAAAKEEFRFREVLKLIEHSHTNRPLISPEIVKQFGDGKWHDVEAIARALDTDVEHVNGSMITMVKYGLKGANANAKAEKKDYGRSCRYRIFKQDKQISSSELLEKLSPIIKALQQEGRKESAYLSASTIAHLAGQLRNLLDGWTE